MSNGCDCENTECRTCYPHKQDHDEDWRTLWYSNNPLLSAQKAFDETMKKVAEEIEKGIGEDQL